MVKRPKAPTTRKKSWVFAFMVSDFLSFVEVSHFSIRVEWLLCCFYSEKLGRPVPPTAGLYLLFWFG
jgi:hypothetical protein